MDVPVVTKTSARLEAAITATKSNYYLEGTTCLMDETPKMIKVFVEPWRKHYNTSPSVAKAKPKADHNLDNQTPLAGATHMLVMVRCW